MNYAGYPCTVDVDFAGTDGNPQDCGTMFAIVTSPDGAREECHQPSPQWAHTGLGTYTFTFTPDRPGRYRLRFKTVTPLPAVQTVFVEITPFD